MSVPESDDQHFCNSSIICKNLYAGAGDKAFTSGSPLYHLESLFFKKW